MRVARGDGSTKLHLGLGDSIPSSTCKCNFTIAIALGLRRGLAIENFHLDLNTAFCLLHCGLCFARPGGREFLGLVVAQSTGNRSVWGSLKYGFFWFGGSIKVQKYRFWNLCAV